MPSVAELYNAGLSRGMVPPPRMTVSEWASELRILLRQQQKKPPGLKPAAGGPQVGGRQALIE
jgi:hypothetical protein